MSHRIVPSNVEIRYSRPKVVQPTSVEIRASKPKIVDPARENRLRRRLQKQGLALHRGRCIFPTPTDPNPGYKITNPATFGLVAGAGYEMSLDDVEEFLDGR